MRLTAWEEEHLLIFTAAELARRHRDRGLRLNAPEAVALICDAMLEVARGGATYVEVEAAGRAAVTPDEVLPGVAALVPEVRLEVLMDDGARLVVLLEPLGPAGAGRTVHAYHVERSGGGHVSWARATPRSRVRSPRATDRSGVDWVGPRRRFRRRSSRRPRLGPRRWPAMADPSPRCASRAA